MIKNISLVEYIYSYFMPILLDVAFDMTEEKKILQIGFWKGQGYVSRNQQIESVSWRFCISYLPSGLVIIAMSLPKKIFYHSMI